MLNTLCCKLHRSASSRAACKSFRAHDEKHMFASHTDRLDRFDDQNVPNSNVCYNYLAMRTGCIFRGWIARLTSGREFSRVIFFFILESVSLLFHGRKSDKSLCCHFLRLLFNERELLRARRGANWRIFASTREARPVQPRDACVALCLRGFARKTRGRREERRNSW